SSAAFRPLQLPSWLDRNPFAESLVLKDPPDHTRLRGAIGPAFSPRLMASLEPSIRRVADELSERLVSLGAADFIEEFATVLPARVLCDLLGLDASLRERLRLWIDPIATMSPEAPSAGRIAEIRGLLAEAESYLKEVIEGRRRRPADDLVSTLVGA